MNNWDRSIEVLLEKYSNEAICREQMHRSAFYNFKKRRTWFQLPLIVISALNGGVQLLSKQYPHAEQTIITCTASTSLLVACLTSILSYLKLGELHAQHSKAQSEWLGLYNTIRAQLVLKPELRMDGMEFLSQIKGDYEKLFEFSPIVGQKINSDVRKKAHAANPDFVVPVYINGFTEVETYRREEEFDDNSV